MPENLPRIVRRGSQAAYLLVHVCQVIHFKATQLKVRVISGNNWGTVDGTPKALKIVHNGGNSNDITVTYRSLITVEHL